MSQHELSPQPRFNRSDAWVLTASALVLILFRLHAYPAPLESDECNYAYFAERMLAGDRLYIDLWDHQPPGIFAFLVLPTAVFGSSPTVYRTLALVASLTTLCLLFDTSRRPFGRAASWVAALLFALTSSDPGTAGEGCNREVYLNLLLVAALWIIMGGANHRPQIASLSSPRLFLAATLIGLASVIKTVVAAHWFALLPAILLCDVKSARRLTSPFQDGGRASPPLLKLTAAFVAGPALVWLGVGAYFALTRRWQEFIDAAFAHNLTYGGAGPHPLRRPIVFFQNPNVFRTAMALWLTGAIGLLTLPWRRDLPRALLLGALAVGSYFAICLPGRFWPHYYYLMLPSLILLTAGFIHRIHAQHRSLGWAAAATTIAAVLMTQAPGYLWVPPDLIAWDRYRDRMVWGRDQGRRVASVTDPADTIYVWGADTTFYYYSGRRCATRFTMYLPLIGNDSSAAQRRQVLIEDLTRLKPRLIILPRPPCAELQQFILDHRYVAAGRDAGRMEVLCDIERPIPHLDWTWRSPLASPEANGGG